MSGTSKKLLDDKLRHGSALNDRESQTARPQRMKAEYPVLQGAGGQMLDVQRRGKAESDGTNSL